MVFGGWEDSVVRTAAIYYTRARDTHVHTQAHKPPTPLHTPSPSKIIQDMLDVTAGVVGGSIGVMGTLTALEVKKRAVIESSKVCSKPSLAQQTPVRSLHLRGKKTEMYFVVILTSNRAQTSSVRIALVLGRLPAPCALVPGRLP